MPEQIDVDEVLSRNPQIDGEELAKAREMLQQLRGQGVRRKGYDLGSPFGDHRASVKEDVRRNSRLVRLRGPEGTR